MQLTNDCYTLENF
uniref:Uncharacterized protein n=1 Tax=Anguilla anguilla TaxID=7936 RepID=A0A0E9VVY5_ANGAN